MVERYFPLAEYEARWQRAQDAMAALEVETAVIWGRSGGTYERCGDVLYLANYYGNHSGQTYDRPRSLAAVILRRGEAPELQADELDPRRELVATENAQGSNNTIEAVARSLKAGGAKGRVALVGSDFFPMKYWRQLEAETPGIEWVMADGLIRDLRLIKSPREQVALREAGQIAARALGLLMENLVAGKSEAEAAGEAAREVVRGGGLPQMIPVSHGPYIEHFASDPLPAHCHEAAKKGEMVRGWVYGAMFQGYWMDPGRSAVAGGRPDAAQRELIEATVGVVEEIMAVVRPGVPLGEVIEIGDRLVAAFGSDHSEMADKWPIYGHGIGLFFERPYLSSVLGEDLERCFEEGMAFGIEAFLAREGVGSAGFEENILVTAEGAELLTPAPRLWW